MISAIVAWLPVIVLVAAAFVVAAWLDRDVWFPSSSE